LRFGWVVDRSWNKHDSEEEEEEEEEEKENKDIEDDSFGLKEKVLVTKKIMRTTK
jgi:hypothetical protein